MKNRVRKIFLISIVVASSYLFASPAVLADNEEQNATASGLGLTIFVDVGSFGRKKKAAKKMTELHKSYFDQGYNVIDVEPYIENGDLQGFFVTYVAR